MISSVAEAVAAASRGGVNDTTSPYIGTQYDGVMANTYKAIDYLALGDNEGARVEFNRAIDRQRRAKAYYAELIEKNREAIEKMFGRDFQTLGGEMRAPSVSSKGMEKRAVS